MKTVLVFVCIVFVLLLIIYFLCRSLKDKNQTIKEQDKMITALKKNLNSIVFYSAKMQDINAEKSQFVQEITNAQTDEEVNSIVANIINSNNDRVQN